MCSNAKIYFARLRNSLTSSEIVFCLCKLKKYSLVLIWLLVNGIFKNKFFCILVSSGANRSFMTNSGFNSVFFFHTSVPSANRPNWVYIIISFLNKTKQKMISISPSIRHNLKWLERKKQQHILSSPSLYQKTPKNSIRFF